MADPVFGVRNVTDGEAWHYATLTGMDGFLMCPTVQGTGNAVIEANFGVTQPLLGLPPSGCFAGWLDSDGASPTYFVQDVNLCQGSATVTSPTTVSFPTVSGLAQTAALRNEGGWYFELTHRSSSLFENFGGGGVARAYLGGAGLDPAQWTIARARYSAADPKGGGQILGGHINTWIATYNAIGALMTISADAFQSGKTIGISLLMNPFTNRRQFDMRKVPTIALPCFPCTPVYRCVDEAPSDVLAQPNGSNIEGG